MPLSDRVTGSGPIRYRATPMDRVFAEARIVAAVGPIVGLDPDRTRATVAAAEHASDEPRLALAPEADTSWWDYRTNIAAAGVEHLPDADTSDLGSLLTETRNRSGRRAPLEALVCGDYLAIDISHGLGDGQIGLMMLAAFATDPDGSGARGLAVGLPPGVTRKALRRFYSANPRALRNLWRLRGTHKRKHHPESGSTRTIENWESAKVSRSGYMAPAQVVELKKWAKAQAPGATSASVSIALWAAALRAENVDVDDHIMVLFNSRRYLEPDLHSAHGNFAVGIPLHLPEASGPGQIAKTMRAVIESGWPIAILGMSEVKDTLASIRGRADAPGTQAAADRTLTEVPDRLRLAVSDLGKLSMFGHVRWAQDGRPPQLAASLEPDGPDGVTMLISELEGGRTYTASFCSKFIGDAVIESALARLCSDPVALLRDEVS